MKYKGITIDPPGSKDLDDGFSLANEGTNYVLEVFVSDVSSEVNPNRNRKAYDMAKKRVATRYFAKGNEPMLPREISEGRWSLLPYKTVNALACTIKINVRTLEITDFKVDFGSFKSYKKFSYDKVEDIVRKNKIPETINPDIVDMLNLADKLAQDFLLREEKPEHL